MKKKSYAQIGQDLLALKFFSIYPAQHKAFLDVGAFDGIGFSNSRAFFEQGWSGVCVEPVLKNFAKLQTLYNGTSVITVRAAATDYSGHLELNVATIPWAEDWGSDVSSPTDDALDRWPDYKWEKETVPAMTVNEILEMNNFLQVDFVSIDVEGQELAVLHGFDLSKYRPHLLVVEYSNPVQRRDLIQHMISEGYFLWVDNGQDVFFVRGSAMDHWKIMPRSLWLKLGATKPIKFILRNIKRFLK